MAFDGTEYNKRFFPQPKQKAIRLKGKAYTDLKKKVCERDNHRCRVTGEWADEPPHHIIYRSSSGSDTEDNLIMLNRYIHSHIHHGDPMEALQECVANLGIKKILRYIFQGILRDRG